MKNYRKQLIAALKDLGLSMEDISVVMSLVEKIADAEYESGYKACEADMESK